MFVASKELMSRKRKRFDWNEEKDPTDVKMTRHIIAHACKDMGDISDFDATQPAPSPCPVPPTSDLDDATDYDEGSEAGD